MMKQPLAFQWGVSPLFGWGVYGLNLALHGAMMGSSLISLCPINEAQLGLDRCRHSVLADFLLSSKNAIQNLPGAGAVTAHGAVVLHALGNNLRYAAKAAKDAVVFGQRTYGVTFLEDCRQLDGDAIAKGRSYDRMIAGSQWNADFLKSNGIDRVSVVIQGIDPTLFHPAPRLGLFRGKFAVFSGGKLEYRKGQDIVVKAFRRFHQKHPDSVLVTAWHSPWAAGLARSMEGVADLAPVPLTPLNQLNVHAWCQANGIPAQAVIDLGAVPNSQMPQILREMDAAIFPNRCEGGTNLVAMEAMACGVPVILSDNTGHRDIIYPDSCYRLQHQERVSRIGCDLWGDSDPDELADLLEQIYTDQAEARRRGQAAAHQMSLMTWRKSIEDLFAAIA